jgi:hypothetical protein
VVLGEDLLLIPPVEVENNAPFSLKLIEFYPGSHWKNWGNLVQM